MVQIETVNWKREDFLLLLLLCARESSNTFGCVWRVVMALALAFPCCCNQKAQTNKHTQFLIWLHATATMSLHHLFSISNYFVKAQNRAFRSSEI